MGWIDQKKVKANASQLAAIFVALVVSGFAAWHSGRFLAYLIGVGIAAAFVLISVVNYWIRRRKASN